ncbi:MAG: cyclic nucleotide-binding domain-containing protein [Pseudomonadota bacterium]
MKKIMTVLSDSSVFQSIETADVEKTAALFEKRDVLPGEVIATAGEAAQNFFLLDKGTVLLGMKDGKEVVLNQTGDFIAMELISAKEIYRTTATVLEKGCVYAIARDQFLNVIQEDTPVAEKLMHGWQDYLNQTAPFAAKLENLDTIERF